MKKHTRKIILAFCFLFFINLSFAQNLVPNGSFEEYAKGKCPEMAKQQDKNDKIIPHWIMPTILGTTDYFNACSKRGIVSVPKNFAGRSSAKHGKGYTGMIALSKTKGKKDYREYLEAKLTKKLEKDKLYCVSFFYRLVDCAAFSIDRLGVYFSPTEVRRNIDKNLGFKPQVASKEGVFLDNNSQWTPLYSVYKATGNEQYILIGNFFSDAQTQEKARNMKRGCDKRKNYAYYYIDSVQVMELKWDCEPCVCVAQDLKVEIGQGDCFNGGTDLSAIVSGGTEPYHQISWDKDLVKKSFYKHAITGTHNVKVTDDWGCETSSSVTFDCGKPLTAKVVESGYTGGNTGFAKLKVFDGIPPYKFKWSNGAKTKDVRGLSFGSYIFTVTDKQGAEYIDTVEFTVPKLLVEADTNYTKGNDGFIHLTVKSGMSPYKFSWASGDTTANRDSLSAGKYIYKVTDASNQTATDTIHFIAPIEVEIESGFTFETDGFVKLKVKGDCPPYTYKWSNDSTVSEMKYLENALYKFTVTGSCGQVYKDTVRIKGQIVLNSVLFKTGSDKLLSSSFPELDRVIKYMKRKTKIRVEISGHTDNQGGDKANQKLSEKRAKSVVKYLTEKGIAENRLEYKGYGEARPVASNDTAKGRKQNRRVEFSILE